MSSDAKPSFRARLGSKLQNVIKPNASSSIRERIMSDDTYDNLRNKYRNITDDIKEQPGIAKILNKTKEFTSGISIFDGKNKTSPNGFYDSLFSSDTEEGLYFKTAIYCLWTIAILCIISTMVTMFLRVGKCGVWKPTSINLIFFHIFLCELLYLLYILLSMINVAQHFQMSRLFCDFANYGAYVTIPVMYLALLLLAVERITKEFDVGPSCTNMFINPCGIQVILCFFWILFSAVLILYLYVKQTFAQSIVQVKDMASPIIAEVFSKPFSSNDQCSIDGRLSSVFKIVFVILCIILFVIIIKSIILSTFYNQLRQIICKNSSSTKTKRTDNITLTLIIFVVLNLIFAFPFYFKSISFSITEMISRNVQYPTKLKIYFLCRIFCIVLECLTFYTLEEHSWGFLSRLVYRGPCKKYKDYHYGELPSTGSSTKAPIEPDVHPDYENSDSTASDVGSDNNENKTSDKDLEFQGIHLSGSDGDSMSGAESKIRATDVNPSEATTSSKKKEVNKTNDNTMSTRKTTTSVVKTNEVKLSDDSDEDNQPTSKKETDHRPKKHSTRKRHVRRRIEKLTDSEQEQPNEVSKTNKEELTKDGPSPSTLDIEASSDAEEDPKENKQLPAPRTVTKPTTDLLSVEQKPITSNSSTDHRSKQEHPRKHNLSSTTTSHRRHRSRKHSSKIRRNNSLEEARNKDYISTILDKSIEV